MARTDVREAVRATGGPFFRAQWKEGGQWHGEDFRLFSRAKERCVEEIGRGAPLAYVSHLATDEPVWSSRLDDLRPRRDTREAEPLAGELWKVFDGQYGHGIANGYWPDFEALWKRGREWFGSKWKDHR